MITTQDFQALSSTRVDLTHAPTLPAGYGVMNDPSRLDRLADRELQQGHHAVAERLAWRAAELRGWA